MEEKFRLAVGMMGNAASMLLYAAPILTFLRVIRKKSTEDFSSVPYVLALFNCLLYTWYGLPIVSDKWENFPVVTVNGVGILLEISFIGIYFYFTSAGGKKRLSMWTISVALSFTLIAILSAFAFHDHRRRKAFVGSIGLAASVAMYGSPLVAVKQVIRTKSVEFMPFYLSLFSFLASSMWMAYGFLSHDIILASPNLVGCPLGILQLFVYCVYRRSGEDTGKWNREKNDDEEHKKKLEVMYENEDKPDQYIEVDEGDDKMKQQIQIVVPNATNDKM